MYTIDRRTFLSAGVSAILVETTAGASTADDPVAKGRRFLVELFDAELGLLPEYHGARVYWLYHDNYLAAKVLDRTDPAIAAKIRKAIASFGVTHSGKIEILFNEAKRPLPFRKYDLIVVKSIGEKVIKTEVVTEAPSKGWQEYADLLFLAAIAEPDRSKALAYLKAGLATWDGHGFRDRVVEKHKQYATYKLALSLIAAAHLREKPEPLNAIRTRLLALQGKAGGWITDYNSQSKPIGFANVETTSLAILALEAAI